MKKYLIGCIALALGIFLYAGSASAYYSENLISVTSRSVSGVTYDQIGVKLFSFSVTNTSEENLVLTRLVVGFIRKNIDLTDVELRYNNAVVGSALGLAHAPVPLLSRDLPNYQNLFYSYAPFTLSSAITIPAGQTKTFDFSGSTTGAFDKTRSGSIKIQFYNNFNGSEGDAFVFSNPEKQAYIRYNGVTTNIAVKPAVIVPITTPVVTPTVTVTPTSTPVTITPQLSGSLEAFRTDNMSIYNRIKGNIILKPQDSGKAYYVHPTNRTLYFLGLPGDAYEVMRSQGVGITMENLKKIQVGIGPLSGSDQDNDGLSNTFEDAMSINKNLSDNDGDGFNDRDELLNGYNPAGAGKQNFDFAFAKSQAGRILLQVESRGEAWYVNPKDNKRYFLGRAEDAYSLMRSLAMGVSNGDFDSLR